MRSSARRSRASSSSRDVDVGQTVAASLSAPQIFSIAQNLAQMQIDTTVAEADVGAVRAGMAAVFLRRRLFGRIFHGTVRQIRLNPKTNPTSSPTMSCLT